MNSFSSYNQHVQLFQYLLYRVEHINYWTPLSIRFFITKTGIITPTSKIVERISCAHVHQVLHTTSAHRSTQSLWLSSPLKHRGHQCWNPFPQKHWMDLWPLLRQQGDWDDTNPQAHPLTNSQGVVSLSEGQSWNSAHQWISVREPPPHSPQPPNPLKLKLIISSIWSDLICLKFVMSLKDFQRTHYSCHHGINQTCKCIFSNILCKSCYWSSEETNKTLVPHQQCALPAFEAAHTLICV